MRRLALAALMLAAACEPAPPAPPPPEARAPEPVPAPAPPPVNLPPPPRYVGRWAASADLCTTGWWRFWNDELRTGIGEMRCDILPPDAESGDERRRAVCVAEGEMTREDWLMSYPAERTMTISRNGAAPVTLGKCA